MTTCARTGWGDHDDQAASCAPLTAAVSGNEHIARLRHTTNSEPLKKPWGFGEMKPSSVPQNVCNEGDGSSGPSIIRCDGLTDDELRQRAKALADLRPGRVSLGTDVWNVSSIRAISPDGQPATRSFMVYDDPTPGEPRHAVLRFVGGGRPEYSDARDKLFSCLHREIV